METNKNTQNQTKKKSPAGRKPIADKKVVVTLFIRQSEIDKRGGKEAVQKQCYDFLDNDSFSMQTKL
jgi:hypothetical protein